MQIVIEMNKKDYDLYKVDDWNIPKCLRDALANGNPLPKGHGRLIDADELLKRIAEKCKTPSLSEDTVNGLCGATAIIYNMLNESGQESELQNPFNDNRFGG